MKFSQHDIINVRKHLIGINMYKRFLSDKITTALSFSPVTYLGGPRQAGKSTLAEMMSGKDWKFISLDNVELLMAAKNAPRDFITMQDNPCVIDEIQRAPELILPIKEFVDKNRLAGHFLLTGSASLLTMPNIADSLAGRMTLLTLFPLSVQEILKRRNNWIDHIFSTGLQDIFSAKSSIEYNDLCQFIIKGGYPVVWKNITKDQRNMWFQSYIQTMIERDLRDISNFSDAIKINRLFKDLTLRSATMINILELSRECQIPASSTSLYIEALESIFLVSRAPAWFTNLHKRLVKSPKSYMNDSGILCHMLNINEDSNFAVRPEWGHVVETFIYNELRKQISWSTNNIGLFHYRTYNGIEVDFILEDQNRDIVGIEVKASRGFSSNFSKNMERVRDEVGEKFKAGIVLYMGENFVPLSDRIYAVPMGYVL